MPEFARPFAALSAGLILSTALVASATQHQTVFERLHAFDARAHVAQRRHEELREQMEPGAMPLDDTWAAMDLARRAAKPIRIDVNRTFANWLSSFRAARREALHGPVAAEDSLRLLSYAAPRTLPTKLQDVDVIRRADEQAQAYHALIFRRADLTFELARTAAVVATAKAGRRELIAAARTVGAEKDLDLTDALLTDKLAAVASVDAAFDFHRFKGTLARPVSAPPTHGFGSTGPLLRGTGLTWRGQEHEVRIAGAGTIVLVESIQGWGRVVVADHGGGYRSVYAHLDRIDVAVGDHIERAAILGVSGDSGSLDGPRFHFELRKNGAPLDPASWFLQP